MKKTPQTVSSVLVWSVISAAFIGPGTITTAITAGATHRLELLWAVTLATVGCMVLQEVSARVIISSGSNLARAAVYQFGKPVGGVINVVVGLTVIAGCAAYEAGNILGAVSGLNLITGADAKALTVVITAAAFGVLWTNRKQLISWLMTFLVGLMGIAFLALATQQPFTVSELMRHAVVPSFPSGAELLILGLVGTTIVPYNIFMGSAIGKGQTIPLMRFGLLISVMIGGVITAAIVVAGTSVGTFHTFPELATSLAQQLGPGGSWALGIGLFAAGFSSAITAPYASSIIASTVLGWEAERRLRWVWGTVLLVGFLFGISGVKPIPVILTVQALNGLILPLLVVLLIAAVNQRALIPAKHLPGLAYNVVLLVLLGSVVLVGLNQVVKTFVSLDLLSQRYFHGLVGCSGLLVAGMGVWLYRVRTRSS